MLRVSQMVIDVVDTDVDCKYGHRAHIEVEDGTITLILQDGREVSFAVEDVKKAIRVSEVKGEESKHS